MKQLFKLTLVWGVFIILSFARTLWIQGVEPAIEADLAVNQLKEDGSRESLRILQQHDNDMQFVLNFATGIMLAVALVYTIKVVFLRKEKDNEKKDCVCSRDSPSPGC